ncbi:MAG TPA: retropepsin-like aspartic protease [Terracidiphilus sp.]|nr:retropepsin-like aspartic protease [Terracidiphilus sp.]
MRIPRAFSLVVTAALALSIAASPLTTNRKPSPGGIRGTTETIPFDLYQGYFTVVHGSIGPLKNLNFFLDTGTRPAVLDTRIAKKLHLRAEDPATISIVGGKVAAQWATLPSLEIGPVHRSNLPIVITDLSFFRKTVPVRIDAIVGLDLFVGKPFLIDYSARKIRFEAAPALSVSVPMRLDHGFAVFDAEIDHKPVHLLLDTGAASLILFTKTTPQSTPSRRHAVLRPQEIGKFESKHVSLPLLKLGTAQFRKKNALLTLNPNPSQADYDGLISPAALGLSQVAVNVEEGTLAFRR